MIEMLTNFKLIFFVTFFFLMLLLETYFPQRTWGSRRIFRIGFHGLIAIINTFIMRLPTIFLVIPALMLINENEFGILNSTPDYVWSNHMGIDTTNIAIPANTLSIVLKKSRPCLIESACSAAAS